MQKLTKICYIVPEYNQSNESHFYHIYEFLKELSKRVDLFILVEKSLEKAINIGNGFYVQKFHFLPLRWIENFIVILNLRIRGYKIFYTHYSYISAINAGIISRLTGAKSFYWNCAMNWLFKRTFFSELRYVLSLKFSNFLVTGGEEMKKSYAEHYKLKCDKIKLLPNRINLERFKPKPKIENSEFKNILFVHWLSKRKGADTIVPIAKALLSNFKDFKFTIVGDGPYKKQLLKEIKDNNLESYIEIIGGIPNQKIVDYYAEADILILPSMEEGFPMTLLEAMAMGVPYVATDVGAVREISPETAQRFLTRPGEVEKFAQKIEILITDTKIYKKFREEELEKVKEYSIEKVINKFIELFK
jgi:glycosyltransferase involved in cell wall biosynthesis